MHNAVDMTVDVWWARMNVGFWDNRIHVSGELVPDRQGEQLRYWTPNDDETDEYIELIEGADLADDEEPVYVSEEYIFELE